MALHDLSEFLKLSSVLHYNLSAASINRFNLLMFINRNHRLSADEAKDREIKALVMEVLAFLFQAYRQKKRRLGPMAVIHPIRTAALLARAGLEINLVALLSALLHDLLEDIRCVDFDPPNWRELETTMTEILARLEPEIEDRLLANLLALTKIQGESYYHYVGRLLDKAETAPESIPVKLADRLDNTLDMRIGLDDPLTATDVYESIFQTLFVANYPGKKGDEIQPEITVINGARRLFQLFKNAVLLSLVRQRNSGTLESSCRSLFNALCTASLNEAQRTLIKITGKDLPDIGYQRQLILEAMTYCHEGRIDLVTKPNESRPMDGLFSSYFGQLSRKERNARLDLLYQNKPLMVQASVAFITIFLSFLNDPEFYVRGISADGMDPR